MIRKILTINNKNIKRLLDSKLSFISIILGPLILISLLGIAFGSSSFSGVEIGVHFGEKTSVVNDFLSILEGRDFEIVYLDSKEICIDSVMSGEVAICLFVEDNNLNKLEFFIDYSRITLSNSILLAISSQINVLSKDLSLDSTEAILNFLKSSSNQINSSMSSIESTISNLYLLQTAIQDINRDLSSFDVSDRVALLKSLNDPNSDLSNYLDRANEDIDSLDFRIDATIKELTFLDDLLDNSSNNLNTAFSNLNCDSKFHKDLNEYIVNGGFFEEVSLISDPECSLIYTLEKNVNSRGFEIKDTIQELKTIQTNAKTTKQELNNLERTILTQSRGLEQDLLSADSSRSNIQDSLSNIQSSSKDGEEQIVLIKESLENLSFALNNISRYRAEDIVSPITTKFEQADNIDRTFFDYLIPGLMLLVIMFVGILLGNILIMKEKFSLANFRNLINPTNKLVFLIGIYFTALIFVFLQAIIFLGISYFVFKSNIQIDFVVFLEILISGLIFISIGIIIGNVSRSEEISILSAISFAVLMLMFSNLLVPIETMVSILSELAKLSPFNVLEYIFRRHLTYGYSIFSVSSYTLMVVTIQTVGLVLLSYFTFLRKNQ